MSDPEIMEDLKFLTIWAIPMCLGAMGQHVDGAWIFVLYVACMAYGMLARKWWNERGRR